MKLIVEPKDLEEAERLGAIQDEEGFLHTPKGKKISIFEKFMPLRINVAPIEQWKEEVIEEIGSEAALDSYKRGFYKESNYMCSVCGERGEDNPICVSPQWELNNKYHIQTFTEFKVLCPKCYASQNLIETRKYQPKREEELIRHLAKVNGTELCEMREYAESKIQEYIKSQKMLWVLNIEEIRRNFKLKPRTFTYEKNVVDQICKCAITLNKNFGKLLPSEKAQEWLVKTCSSLLAEPKEISENMIFKIYALTKQMEKNSKKLKK